MALERNEATGVWQRLEADLSGTPLEFEINRNPFYSESEWDVCEVRYKSAAGFRLFAWMSVPSGEGPFPAVVFMPDYGSAIEFPYTPLRQDAIVINASHRGQRHNDTQFQAAFPGLLTQGIESPGSYALLDICADALRAVDLVLEMPQVDSRRVVVTGDGLGATLAILAGALRPQIKAISIETPLMIGTSGALELVGSYPLDEVKDYLRTNPELRESVLDTIRMFDPLEMAGNVSCPVLLGVADKDTGYCPPPLGDDLAARFKHCQVRSHHGGAGEQGGYKEVVSRTNWIREQLEG